MNSDNKFIMNIFISLCYCLEKDNFEVNQECVKDQKNYSASNEYNISKSEIKEDKSLKILSKDILIKEIEKFNISCEEYAPHIFSYLRKLDKIDKKRMIISLLPMNNKNRIKDSKKNENSVIETDDNELILKSITLNDVNAICGGHLNKIVDHLSTNPNSIIERIYGIYKITKKKFFSSKDYYFILIKNIVGPFINNIVCKFSLKGSRFKSKDKNFNMDEINTKIYGDLDFKEKERVLLLNEIFKSKLLTISNCDAKSIFPLLIM